MYHITWDAIQIGVSSRQNGARYLDNAGSAVSEGFELSVQSRPRVGLNIIGWVAWNRAELTQDMPLESSTIGIAGDPLPYSARFTGSLSAQQHVALAGSTSGFFGASVSYVGQRFISFQSNAKTRAVLPAYARLDARLGIEHDSWTANLFVNNLTDCRGMLARGVDAGPPYAVNYIQPRTFGLSLLKTF